MLKYGTDIASYFYIYVGNEEDSNLLEVPDKSHVQRRSSTELGNDFKKIYLKPWGFILLLYS